MMARLAERARAWDERVDAAVEPIRHRSHLGTLFRFASQAGDFSVIWQVIGLLYGLGIDRDWRHVVWFSALLGTESLLVNQGVKRLFRRTRPTETGHANHQVRKPTTSSFPSGHASSGFFAATVLTDWAGMATAPLWFLIAAVVAGSRVFVRIHHPSDVLAGALFGLTLGGLAVVTGLTGVLTG